MPVHADYIGGLVVGAPSIIGTWGFELLREAAAAMEPPLQVTVLDRLDEITLDEPPRRTLYLTQFPSPSVLAIIEDARLPVVAFLDEATDAVAYMRRISACAFIDALRSSTCAAVGNRALYHGASTAVIHRARTLAPDQLIEHLLDHLTMRLPRNQSSLLKEKYCRRATSRDITIEHALQGMPGYQAPGEWSNELTSEEATIADQALGPLVAMALQEECGSIKWPISLFLSGDRPNESAPVVIEIAGIARILYYGPYLYLPPGKYRVRLMAGFSQSAVGSTFSVEAHGSAMMAKAYFRPLEAGIFKGEFLLVHQQPQEHLELRFRNEQSAIAGQFGLAWVELLFLH